MLLITVGFPDNDPDELKDNPVGKDGDIEKLTAPTPPVAVTGLNAEILTNSVNVLSTFTTVTVKGTALTVKLKIAELVWCA